MQNSESPPREIRTRALVRALSSSLHSPQGTRRPSSLRSPDSPATSSLRSPRGLMRVPSLRFRSPDSPAMGPALALSFTSTSRRLASLEGSQRQAVVNDTWNAYKSAKKRGDAAFLGQANLWNEIEANKTADGGARIADAKARHAAAAVAFASSVFVPSPPPSASPQTSIHILRELMQHFYAGELTGASLDAALGQIRLMGGSHETDPEAVSLGLSLYRAMSRARARAKMKSTACVVTRLFLPPRLLPPRPLPAVATLTHAVAVSASLAKPLPPRPLPTNIPTVAPSTHTVAISQLSPLMSLPLRPLRRTPALLLHAVTNSSPPHARAATASAPARTPLPITQTQVQAHATSTSPSQSPFILAQAQERATSATRATAMRQNDVEADTASASTPTSISASLSLRQTRAQSTPEFRTNEALALALTLGSKTVTGSSLISPLLSLTPTSTSSREAFVAPMPRADSVNAEVVSTSSLHLPRSHAQIRASPLLFLTPPSSSRPRLFTEAREWEAETGRWCPQALTPLPMVLHAVVHAHVRTSPTLMKPPITTATATMTAGLLPPLYRPPERHNLLPLEPPKGANISAPPLHHPSERPIPPIPMNIISPPVAMSPRLVRESELRSATERRRIALPVSPPAPQQRRFSTVYSVPLSPPIFLAGPEVAPRRLPPLASIHDKDLSRPRWRFY